MNHKAHESQKELMNHKAHEEHKAPINHKAHEDHKAPINHKAHEDHKEDPDKLFEPLPSETERVIREIIGGAIAVHRELGPGFIESVYGRALNFELNCRNLSVDRQRDIPIRYRGQIICTHRLDLVVEDSVVVEVKAVRKLKPIHKAQILSYMKAGQFRAGLLMNFNVKLLVDGLDRFVR